MKKERHSRSGFFNLRVLISLSFCLIGILLALLAFGLFPSPSAQAQGQQLRPALQTEHRGIYQGVLPVVHFDISQPLRDMPPVAPARAETKREDEERGAVPPNLPSFEPDPVVQSTISGIEIPPPLVSFDAQPGTASPPDPNSDVGPNHIVVMSNVSTQIFNKTGTSLMGPFPNNQLFAGFGGPCQTQNAGDPVVIYDQLADRWLLSQFTSGAAPFFNCVAVSQTPDPTGAYFRYAIITGTTGANFPDYPKYGMMPDAYHLSTREFLGSAGPFQGVGAYALNRAQFIAGNPAAQVIFFIAPPGGTPFNVGDGLLPADMDGTTLPPAGSDQYYVGSMDNPGPYSAPQDALTLWKFHVDFAVPANSTFTLANTIAVAPFDSLLGICSGRACIPQPGTANRIDHLGYRQRPTFRLSYRNFGTHQSLVTTQSVSGGTGPSGEVSGMRWWEIRNPQVAPVIFQEGTYAPGVTDGVHRWMGSIAMDSQGNMGLAYSAGNGSIFPSVWYTGRLAGDPLGQMTLGENVIVQGLGSQTGGGNRWGDYTSLSVDPVDDLTFWHVNQYLPVTAATAWRLRVGAFKALPGGASPTPIPTPTPATPTPSPTATPSGTPATPSPTPCDQNLFTNSTAISLPDSGPATPYPSNISVAGLTGTITKVTVRLKNLTHSFPADIDLLLVSPGGQNAIIMSDVGGGDDVANITLTLDDAAALAMPAALLTGGTFRPTNAGAGDTWPAPAPAPAGGSPLSVFNGGNPNGTWALYAVDDAAQDLGTFAGGWDLIVSVSGAICATPTPTPSPTLTPSATPTPTITPTPTPTATPDPTPTPSPTPTITPTPTPSPTPAAQAVNLSTRMRVQTGDNVGIGGFIIQGTAPKHVLLRAIGPSITGLPGVLADPVLELHGPAGFTTVTNNNWQDDPVQAAAILATGLAPTNNLESAIDATLNPGAYTGVVRGNGGTSGIGLVEVYDLSQAVLSKLGNISTRALVGTGNDIVIAGFILGNNSGTTRIVIRGIGGSLILVGPLANPTLELRNSSGALLASNDNWQDDPAQAAELTAAGLAPTNASESGIAITLGPGQYTALLAGQGNTTGIGVVEVYDRGAP